MSGLHARGIVLDADFETVVLRATAEDVRRFARGSAVDLRHADGAFPADWELRRHVALNADYGYGRTAGPCVAVLRTACGCEKRMPIDPTARPPREIRVAISRPLTSRSLVAEAIERGLTSADACVREFALRGFKAEDLREGTRYLVAEYEEVVR